MLPGRLVHGSAAAEKPMTASDSNKDFRQRLLDLIDHSGVSDRQISLLATNSPDTVRNMRRGICPRLDTIEALCRCTRFAVRARFRGQGLGFL